MQGNIKFSFKNKTNLFFWQFILIIRRLFLSYNIKRIDTQFSPIQLDTHTFGYTQIDMIYYTLTRILTHKIRFTQLEKILDTFIYINEKYNYNIQLDIHNYTLTQN